jgi:hypothetical protein
MLGGFLDRPKDLRVPFLPGLSPDVFSSVGAQRRRITVLSKRNGILRKRGKHLLAEAIVLAEKLGQSSRNLAETYVASRTAMAELQLIGSKREGGISKPRENMAERVLGYSSDLVEALQQATEILKMEFSDSEGSGRETLAKCERLLQRTRKVWTIELPLD